ncbi:PREDICTED: plant UBX domain-containing protein 10-like [Tarenaya hassleriana]|uniref:plant UBX domain-containing protein 10-like n=1 Tax=Tarenaya hassleriana TaxID=28532 RepID=UPI00053C0FBF|nr:PREDICTED: plant UBX domain-containing protein 10-like [Tarenaya hassleriana]
MADVADKLAYFQAITGLDDPDLCTDILQAHGWDLELAISSFTSSNPNNDASSSDFGGGGDRSANTAGGGSVGGGDMNYSPSHDAVDHTELAAAQMGGSRNRGPPGVAWRIITLPISIVSGSLGLVSGAIGLGLWAAGGVLSYSLGMLGLGSGRSSESSARLMSVSAAAAEAMDFVAAFEREYGSNFRPNFVADGFMDALQRSRSEFKLLFVYLHSPDHPDTPVFCERTLCNEAFAAFVNENFVSWGGSIRASEGFKMSNSLKASRYPFCAVVMPAANQRIALLQQVEGPKSAEEMLAILQRVLEDSSPVLVAARVEAEERRNNMRLREEQDAAYRAALEADQARERQIREEQERVEREAAEAERKRKEEEEARERAEREAADREAARTRMRQEKALALGDEPEKGPDVTQVLVRFPNGERKGRRFESTATIQKLYDYVDSLGVLETEEYSLVSNFPRTVYGRDKLSMSLKEAGLHPQASLFIEMN